MNLGNLQIDEGAFLAPLCGVTTRPFRKICRRFGASIVFSETISSDGLFQMNARTLEMSRFDPEERPMGVQIFGCDPERVAVAARIVEDLVAPDVIDLNFGCPVPKFTKNDKGAALLKSPAKVRAIVKAVTAAVATPVTAKIRAGWSEKSIVVSEIARIVEGEGGAALTVHGRTRTQGYGGEANWGWIEEAVKAVSIPVIGNGDVTSAAIAKRRMKETGCAAVMVGRASIGNPWIFRSIADGEDAGEPDAAGRLRTILDHLALQIEDRGPVVGIREFRRHLSCYVRGFPGSAAFRNRANRIESREELEESVSGFFGRLAAGAAHGS
ncbi:MAG: tRNA dihydrouridine synthase DusB [Candidatus Eisenbacteria bacterium]